MLTTRILSALVMAPPALAAIWWGGYAFAALVLIAVAIMCWEWDTIVTKHFGWSGRLSALGCAIAVATAVERPEAAVMIVAAAAVAAAAVAPGHGERARLWAGLGPIYAGLPAVALIWLRGGDVPGRETLFWLMLLVWATDIGAYAAGRTLGGPLLLPRVSPKKTWSGLLGGIVSAGLVGLATALLLGLPHPVAVAAGSGVLAVVAQAGDLMESWFKRRWGVKDSSNVIPGHGGVLDRVDGLLAVALAVAMASLATGMTVLHWQ
ncbi:MAG TPA: phosphatidate cytidylyltransferase [Magnetospirillum sp.]|nr:phosphatidate cytidylyltransferase [Magnetospirillum sp.]